MNYPIRKDEKAMTTPYYQEPGIQLNQCSNPKGMKERKV